MLSKIAKLKKKDVDKNKGLKKKCSLNIQCRYLVPTAL
jgi:hypothetical protein